ncbi:MAG: RNA polymerase-binding protein DksA [Sphingomonadaceae bacterium]|nr:RNA polymerase-binding protein DksA [Sphingomonadaceae bacterium]
MATALRSGYGAEALPFINGRRPLPRAPSVDILPLDAALPFMCEAHKCYFRAKLIGWKRAIERETKGTRDQLQSGPLREADANDRASSETDWSIELRTRDRQRKLIMKIDSALRRIDRGEYGFCEVTGEPIALARLDARPVATMTVEAQERHERREKTFRE